MKVWDAFLYNGEKEVLQIRCEELKSLDVTHVLIESNFTFTGNPKKIKYPLFQYLYQYNISPFLCTDMPNNGNAWDNERVQRDYILTTLKNLGAKDEDIVIVSDADEIPSLKAIQSYKPEMGLTALRMDVFWYKINCLAETQTWLHPRIMTFEYLKKTTPNAVRSSGYENIIDNAGWHLSYMGTPDYIVNKIRSFSHTEYNQEEYIGDKEQIQSKIELGISLWGKGVFNFLQITDSFPQYVYNNQEEFSHLIHKL